MTKWMHSFLISAFLLMHSHVRAAETLYECPREIHTEQSAVKVKIPEGWQAKRNYNFEPQLRTHLLVYDGPPEDGASLVPDIEDSDPVKTVWTFNKKKERSIWLGCEYVGTRIVLAKELPTNVTSCRLLLEKTKSKDPIGLICK
jgi:hypothetical protein